MEIKLKGTVKTLIKDYGFIYSPTDDNDYFFHISSIDNLHNEEENLQEGDAVSFYLRKNRGRDGNHAYRVNKIDEVISPRTILKPKKKKQIMREADDWFKSDDYMLVCDFANMEVTDVRMIKSKSIQAFHSKLKKNSTILSTLLDRVFGRFIGGKDGK